MFCYALLCFVRFSYVLLDFCPPLKDTAQHIMKHFEEISRLGQANTVPQVLQHTAPHRTNKEVQTKVCVCVYIQPP